MNELIQPNTIHCADCMDGLREMPDNYVDLAIVDPPYNIGLAAWDNIPNYMKWLSPRLKECARVLKSTGTLWLFHMSFSVLSKIDHEIMAHTSMQHKQLITIDKGLQSVAGRTSEALRSYPKATEYVQLYTHPDPTGAQQLSSQYAQINPMAEYLSAEFKRAGVKNREIAALFPSKSGALTGCVSNWILGFNFPTREQYTKIRAYLNDTKGDYLRKEYDYLRKEYEDLRYVFNLEPGCTDVWSINFYKDSIAWHPSPKPVALLKRIINTASNSGGLVFDPFIGSGATAIAAIETGREYIGYEIDPEYFVAIEERVYQFTRQTSLALC